MFTNLLNWNHPGEIAKRIEQRERSLTEKLRVLFGNGGAKWLIPCCNKVKDSGIDWIGYIPESWNVRTLYQLVTQVKNKNSELQENNLLSLSYGKIKRKD